MRDTTRDTPVSPVSPFAPSRKHYARLGIHHNASVERAVEAFAELAAFYDPRRWPLEHQAWIISVQDDVDEAMSVIYDAARMGVGR
jgi:hypothetical protein